MGQRITATTLWLAAVTVAAYAQSPAPGTGPAAAPAADLEIVTDRPDVTESSIVVPKGSLQFENGMTWTSDHGQTALDLTETLVRLGIADRTELRFVVPNYLAALTGPGSGAGFGDVAIGMKQQLGPLAADVDLSVIIAVSLPTGAHQASSHGYDPFIKFPWSKDLKAGWSIGGMESLFWYTIDGRRDLTGEHTFYIEKQISKPWDAFMEYAGDYAQRGGSKELLHFGTAYKLTPKNQIDFHFGYGLSQATAGKFYAVGYSVLFDNIWKR
jgi:hypothetical protein